MSNSESQHKKHPGGRKPKFDYRGEEFLSQVETYAKKGFTDREIAYIIGLSPQKFSEKKNKYSELSDVLTRGRATVTATIRAKYFAMAIGGTKIKTEVRRFVQERCQCDGKDKHCPDCGGTGWITLTDKAIVQETITELAPSLQAQSVILYHYDPEWKNVERKQEVDEENEVDIEESKWITNASN